jgi:hypothetical protein
MSALPYRNPILSTNITELMLAPTSNMVASLVSLNMEVALRAFLNSQLS